jgi:hypothetical protein
MALRPRIVEQQGPACDSVEGAVTFRPAPSAMSLGDLRNQPPSECVVLEIAELGEVGLRAFGFWLFLFSPKYRAQVTRDWHEASAGGRVVLGWAGSSWSAAWLP